MHGHGSYCRKRLRASACARVACDGWSSSQALGNRLRCPRWSPWRMWRALAGVSVTTVSHVINGTRPGQRGARAPRAGGDRAHGLPPEHDRPRARPRRHAVARAGHQRPLEPVLHRRRRRRRAARRAAPGHTLLLGDTREDPEHELRIVRRWPSARSTACCSRRRVGALERALPYLAAQGVPVVLLDRFVDAGARPGRLRQRAADRAARRAPDRPRAPRGSRMVDRHPRAEHHRRARARLPARRSSSAGLPVRRRRWSPTAARSATARATRCTRCSTSPTRRPRVVSGNNFMTIGAAARRSPSAGCACPTTSRWSPSTTSSGPTSSHRG